MLALIFLIFNILRYMGHMKVYKGIWGYVKVYKDIQRYIKVYEGM